MKLGSLDPRTRLWPFALFGAATGGVFSLLALRAVVLAAVTHTSLGVPTAPLLALCPVCGAIGGVLAALSFPLTRWLGGAFIVGALAMAPYFVALGLLL